MGFIDCDGHLIEIEDTWRYLDPSEAVYRPTLIDLPKGTHGLPRPGQAWLVADHWCPYLGQRSSNSGVGNDFEPESTQLLDPRVRLQDLDALGIETEILISSFFISTELDNPIAEAALCRSYNRWVADIVSGYTDRLTWSAVVPLRYPERAFEELEFAANHGAKAVHVKGINHGYFLSDPAFFKIWERAQDFDLAIMVHVGFSMRRMQNIPVGRGLPAFPVYVASLSTLMAGFHDILSSDLPARLPRLRWGFVEGGATWVPAIMQQHARLAASGDTLLRLHRLTPEILEEKRMFVACEADEDIPYLVGLVGENVLCTGTDYPHNDIGSELAAHTTLMQREDIPDRVAAKIVDTNGRKLLGLKPAPAGSELSKSIPTSVPNVRRANTTEGAPLLTTYGR